MAPIRGTVRNKRSWTPEEDEKLIDALMKLHASGKYGVIRLDNGFKSGYFQAVQNLMDLSLPNSGLKADPHIKSRLKTMKINFSIFHNLVIRSKSNTSGFNWDSEKCVVTAPSDVWKEYLKSRKKASIFKDKAFPYYHKLCTIFGKDRSDDLGEKEVVTETQDTTKDNTPINLEDLDVDQQHVCPSQGVEGGRRLKRKKRKRNDELINVFSDSCNTLNITITAIGNEMNINLSKIANDEERKLDLMRRVQDEIDGLQGITFEEAFEATIVIGMCPFKSDMFFRYDKERKVQMVKMVGKKYKT